MPTKTRKNAPSRRIGELRPTSRPILLPKPAWLHVLAGIELAHGHHAAAERLTHRAEALRGQVAR